MCSSANITGIGYCFRNRHTILCNNFPNKLVQWLELQPVKFDLNYSFTVSAEIHFKANRLVQLRWSDAVEKEDGLKVLSHFWLPQLTFCVNFFQTSLILCWIFVISIIFIHILAYSGAGCSCLICCQITFYSSRHEINRLASFCTFWSVNFALYRYLLASPNANRLHGHCWCHGVYYGVWLIFIRIRIMFIDKVWQFSLAIQTFFYLIYKNCSIHIWNIE